MCSVSITSPADPDEVVDSGSISSGVPGDMNLGSSDYLEFDVCLECGQIQAEYPLPLTQLEIKAALDPEG